MEENSKTKKRLLDENRDWQLRFSDLQRRVGNIAHDLQDPLTNIVGFSTRLSRALKNLTTEEAKMFKLLAKNARLVEEFVKTLRDLGTSGESPLKIVRFDVQDIYDSIRATFFEDLEARNITLLLPEEPIPIDADRVRMIRVFDNIFSNAFKYGGKRMTRIVSKCKDEEEYWLFSVWNNGERLTEEDCERIFDPYFRHEKTCESIEGTGRGLSIVRRIAEKHGGLAWAVPGKKRGMTFYLKIPKNSPKS